MSLKTKHDKHLQDLYAAKQRKREARQLVRESFARPEPSTWLARLSQDFAQQIELVRERLEHVPIQLKTQQMRFLQRGQVLQQRYRAQLSGLLRRAAVRVGSDGHRDRQPKACCVTDDGQPSACCVAVTQPAPASTPS